MSAPHVQAALLASGPEQALLQLAGRAAQGQPAAQWALAQALLEGRACQADPATAVAWLERAANAGLAPAMNLLGRCHELGHGTAANPGLAAVWYRQAARRGLDWGMYNLANLLATGRGVEADPAGAFALYAQAAAIGHAKSMNLVGRCLEEGQGVAADPAAAVHWYQRAAQAGDFRGQAAWASVLVERGQVQAALPWLQRALASGSPAFRRTVLPQLAASVHPQLRHLALGAAATAGTATAAGQ